MNLIEGCKTMNDQFAFRYESHNLGIRNAERGFRFKKKRMLFNSKRKTVSLIPISFDNATHGEIITVVMEKKSIDANADWLKCTPFEFKQHGITNLINPLCSVQSGNGLSWDISIEGGDEVKFTIGQNSTNASAEVAVSSDMQRQRVQKGTFRFACTRAGTNDLYYTDVFYTGANDKKVPVNNNTSLSDEFEFVIEMFSHSKANLLALHPTKEVEGASTALVIEIPESTELISYTPDVEWIPKFGNIESKCIYVKLSNKLLPKNVSRKYDPNQPDYSASYVFNAHALIPTPESSTDLEPIVDVSLLFKTAKESTPQSTTLSNIKFQYRKRDDEEQEAARPTESRGNENYYEDDRYDESRGNTADRTSKTPGTASSVGSWAGSYSTRCVEYLKTLDIQFAKDIVSEWERVEKQGSATSEYFDVLFLDTAKKYRDNLDSFRRTPAFLLSYDVKCPPRLVELLFTDAGYDIDAVDSLNCTCYHWAMYSGSDASCELFEEMGVDYDSVNSFDCTAQEFAEFEIRNAELDIRDKLSDTYPTYSRYIQAKTLSDYELVKKRFQKLKMKQNKFKAQQVLLKNGDAALIVNGTQLEWKEQSLVIPSTTGHDLAVMSYDVLDLNRNKMLQVINTTSKIIVEWNTTKKFDKRACNSLHFVDAVKHACANDIGVTFTPATNLIDKCFNEIKAAGISKPELRLDPYLRKQIGLTDEICKKIGISNNGVIPTSDHTQFDEICNHEVIKIFLKSDKDWYAYFKSFDRALWLNERHNEHDPCECNPTCYFENPYKSGTLWKSEPKTQEQSKKRSHDNSTNEDEPPLKSQVKSDAADSAMSGM